MRSMKNPLVAAMKLALRSSVLLAVACGPDERSEVSPAPTATPEGGVSASILAIEPADGTEAAEPATDVVVTLDGAIDAASVAFVVSGPDGAVGGDVVVDGYLVRFTPHRPFAVLAGYEVSFSAADAAGNRVEGTSRFSTRDAIWREALAVEPRTMDVLDARAHAVGDEAVALWSETTGGATDHVRASLFGGFGWTASEAVATAAAEGFRVASNESAAMAVWQSPSADGDSDVWSAAWTAANGWADAVRLDLPGAHALAPQVGMDDAGAALVIWFESNAEGLQVFARRHADGAWAPAVRLDATMGWEPSLFVSPDGTAIGAWIEDDMYGGSVYASRFDPATGWSAAERVSAGGAWGVQVTRSFATWAQSDDQGYTQVVVRERSATSWEAETVFGAEYAWADLPQIAEGPDGSAILAWQEWTDLAAVVAVRHDGSGFSEPVTLASGVYGVDSTEVTIDGRGNALVVWSSLGDDWSASVSAARWTPVAEWGATALLDEGGFSPTIALRAQQGTGIAVWRSEAGLRYASFD